MKKYDIALSFLEQGVHHLKGMEILGNSIGSCLHRKSDGTVCDECAEILKTVKTQKDDIDSAIQYLKIAQLDLTPKET